jgi:hypothetical protein
LRIPASRRTLAALLPLPPFKILWLKKKDKRARL